MTSSSQVSAVMSHGHSPRFAKLPEHAEYLLPVGETKDFEGERSGVPSICMGTFLKHTIMGKELVLKFVGDWVDGQITLLEAQETAIIVDFCMRLLQLYSSLNIGKISLSSSSTLQSDVETDKCKDLRALLQLLSGLCSKDLVYPEMVGKLNGKAFTQVLQTLDFGLHHQDADVVSIRLRALKALASYHYKEKMCGRTGLGSQASSISPYSRQPQAGIQSQFLRSLLHLLLFEDYSSNLVGVAGDALFPLILCEHGLYQTLEN